jgi:hypothetical protein
MCYLMLNYCNVELLFRLYVIVKIPIPPLYPPEKIR